MNVIGGELSFPCGRRITAIGTEGDRQVSGTGAGVTAVRVTCRPAVAIDPLPVVDTAAKAAVRLVANLALLTASLGRCGG